MTDATPKLENKQAAGVNWDEVRRRLEVAQAALQPGAAPAPELKKKILRERAQALSREPRREDTAQEYIEVVEFLLAHETYGIESRYVREVYPLKELAVLPHTPPFVLGLVNVRGQILSVIDLKKFFDLPEKGLTDLNKLVILEAGDMTFGILADVIIRVRRVEVNELQPTLPTLTGIREEFLRGITPDRVTVLDGGKLLSSREIIVNDDVDPGSQDERHLQ